MSGFVTEQFARICAVPRLQPFVSQLRPARPEVVIRDALFAALAYVPESLVEWFLCHDGLPHQVSETIGGGWELFGWECVHSLEDSLRYQHPYVSGTGHERCVCLFGCPQVPGFVDIDLGGAFLDGASGAMIAPSFEEYLMLWADYATDDRSVDNDYQVLAHFGFDSLSNQFQVWWVESIVDRWLYEREPLVAGSSGPFGDIDACMTEFRRMRRLTIPEPRYVATPLGDHEVVRPAAGYPRLMYAYPDRPETWGPTY